MATHSQVSGPDRATRSHARGPFLPVVFAVAIYCLLALLAYWPVPPLDASHIIGRTTGDPFLFAWFLAWTPFAVLHGHNVLFTNYFNYPNGVNLAANTLMPLMGLLGLPLTRAFGPVASLNFLMRVAFASSAISMCLVLRSWTRWWPAAFFGGLLYGFSQFMWGQGQAHLSLAFVAIPPLLLWCLNELLVRQKRSPARVGLLLGLLCAAQFLVDMEILSDCVLLGVICVLLLAVTHRSEVVSRARKAAPGLLTATVSFSLLAAYPIWFLVAGPRHVSGSIIPIWTSSQYSADLFGPISYVAHAFTRQDGKPWLFGGKLLHVGAADYLGIPLTVVTLMFVLVWRRVGIVRLAGALALVAFVLSLGPHLYVDGTRTNFPLPAILLTHVPLLNDTVWDRFALPITFFVAIVLAVGLDRLRGFLRQELRSGRARHGTRTRRASPAERLLLGALPSMVCVGVAAVSLYPSATKYPVPSSKITWPTQLVTSLRRSVPSGGVVFTFPYVVSATDAPMAWQAIDQMSFRLVGGYALFPAPGGGGALEVFPTPTVQDVETTIAAAGKGTLTSSSPFFARRAKRTCYELPAILREYSVEAVVVWPTGPDPGVVTQFLEPVLGLPSKRFAHALVWYNVPHELEQSRCGTYRGPVP